MLNPSAINVFVYGTLKPGHAAYDRFCAGKTIAEVAAIVPGRLYHLPLGYPAMTLEPTREPPEPTREPPENASTPAAIAGFPAPIALPMTLPELLLTQNDGQSCVQGYCLTFHDPEILAVLDDYESHDWEELLRLYPQAPDGNDYQRIQHRVYTPLGQPLDLAWMYVMTPTQIDRLQGELIPNGNWLKP
ncbi:gamma-glutamylcyclotransferase [Alkalinema sp. FACHB-956]|uniref:gamma-glutamylcyclotransferase family protein n=1 Tax=Alkalinema sp. FACHB-956 TaxID=2692768 RepID=UPI0016860D99|nr:gamma-glutamylcyclotransferase [Alkalinema sp. FACHB-956]MBD2327448.1 gamma-glutamylcyclotransferase [Alkalinema sp. FACHB-956]